MLAVVAVREHPGIEVGRELAAIDHVAARAVVAGRAGRRRADDLVVGEDVAHLLGTGHGLRARPATWPRRRRSPRGRARRRARCRARARRAGSGPRPSRRRRARAARTCRTGARRPTAAARSRSHSSNTSRSTMPTKPPSIGMSTLRSLGETIRRAVDPRDQQCVGDREVADQPRRDGAAAGLDPAGPIEQQHRSARAAPDRAAAVAPAGPPPTTTTSKVSAAVMLTVRRGRRRRRGRPGNRGVARPRQRHPAGEHRPRPGTGPPGPAKTSAVGDVGRAESRGRVGGRPCPRSRRARRRWPGRHPTCPCARLRGPRGRAGQLHHRADGGDGEGAVGDAQAEDRGRSGQPGPTRPAAARPVSITAEARQPPMARRASEPQPAAPERAGQRHGDHASRTPPCCTPDELGRLARREAEDQAGEGLEDQVLGAVGEHRDEDEDGEPARLGLRPDLGERLAGSGAWRPARPVAARGAALRRPRPRAGSGGTRERRRRRLTATSRVGENGSSRLPAAPAVTAMPAIIISQTMVAAAARRSCVDPLGQQDQQRGAGRADADADQQERRHGQGRCRRTGWSPSRRWRPRPAARQAQAPPCRR